MSAFQLDNRVEKESFFLGDLPLCRLLVMNDSQYPWFILVPRNIGVQEIFYLDEEQQLQLACESSILSGTLNYVFEADKMNVAVLGNEVKQLHVHHIVRYEADAAWSEPVWGKHPTQPYEQGQVDEVNRKLKPLFECFD